jgi:hypothetical protein
VRDVYLDGVTASLTVPTLTQMELDVDSGYIYRRGGPMSRKPPTGSSWGTPTYGVVDGIGFYDFNGLRVLVVRELKVAKGASLKVTSFNYKERCYDISGTPWPFSEQGYSLIDKKTFPVDPSAGQAAEAAIERTASTDASISSVPQARARPVPPRRTNSR